MVARHRHSQEEKRLIQKAMHIIAGREDITVESAQKKILTYSQDNHIRLCILAERILNGDLYSLGN